MGKTIIELSKLCVYAIIPSIPLCVVDYINIKLYNKHANFNHLEAGLVWIAFILSIALCISQLITIYKKGIVTGNLFAVLTAIYVFAVASATLSIAGNFHMMLGGSL